MSMKTASMKSDKAICKKPPTNNKKSMPTDKALLSAQPMDANASERYLGPFSLCQFRCLVPMARRTEELRAHDAREVLVGVAHEGALHGTLELVDVAHQLTHERVCNHNNHTQARHVKRPPLGPTQHPCYG